VSYEKPHGGGGGGWGGWGGVFVRPIRRVEVKENHKESQYLKRLRFSRVTARRKKRKHRIPAAEKMGWGGDSAS